MELHGVVRPSSTDAIDPPLLVLLHGLAADENDLIGIAGELPDRLCVVSLRAPLQTGYGGYSWFGIEFFPDGSRRIDSDEALRNRDLLVSNLEALPQKLGIQPSRRVLGGFSQGAMMTAGVLLARPDLVDAAWCMSGRMLPAFEAESEVGKPVLCQHGLYDEVIHVDEGRELAAYLERAGHTVERHEYPMAHQISFESMRDAAAWLESQA